MTFHKPVQSEGKKLDCDSVLYRSEVQQMPESITQLKTGDVQVKGDELHEEVSVARVRC